MPSLLALLILLTLSPAAFAQVDEPSGTSDQNVVVVLDDSGSMNERMRRGGTRKMAAAKQALLAVLDKLPADAEVGILALNTTIDGGSWIVTLGPVDRAETRRRIERIRAGGGTPLGYAMKTAADALLAARAQQVYGTYRLLIVTDGEAGDPRLVEQYLPDIKSRGLITDVIGVDMSEDHSLATRVTSYRRADDPQTLTQAIADVFAESTADPGDAGATDYELLEGLPDELAAAAIRQLTTVDNHEIGSSPAKPAPAGTASVAGSKPPVTRRVPSTVPGSAPSRGPDGLGALCFAAFVMLVIFGALGTFLRGMRSR